MTTASTQGGHQQKIQDDALTISQLGYDSQAQTWQAQLSISSRQTTLHAPNVLDEKILKWYLEDHPLSAPLERVRKLSAEAYLECYGSKLLGRLAPNPIAEDSSEVSILVEDAPGEERSIQELHWEVLEATLGVHGDSRVTVMRVVRAGNPSRETFAHLPSPGPFRVLLIVARQDLLQPNSMFANTLMQCVDSLGSQVLQVDMVRPGTYRAFKKHLQTVSERGIRYNLIHFDLHGSVKARRSKGKNS